MYKLTRVNVIIRVEDNAQIPLDEGNMDYRAYLRWLEEGNTPLPADPPTPDPTPAEKLAASGLTVQELKTLLGLK